MKWMQTQKARNKIIDTLCNSKSNATMNRNSWRFKKQKSARALNSIGPTLNYKIHRLISWTWNATVGTLQTFNNVNDYYFRISGPEWQFHTALPPKREGKKGKCVPVPSFAMGTPSNARMISSFFRTLCASERGLILLTRTPVISGRIWKCVRSWLFSVGWHDKPREQNPTYLPVSSMPDIKCFITGTGIM